MYACSYPTFPAKKYQPTQKLYLLHQKLYQKALYFFTEKSEICAIFGAI